MIYCINNSVLATHASIIAHQVNCMGVMGSGVAAQIKKKYPIAYELYRKYCDENSLHRIGMLGELQLCPVSTNPDGTPRIYVANMFAQYDYGWSKYKVYTDYVALRRCLGRLAEFASAHGYIVAIPYMLGCDRGNGNWEGVVYPMIQSILRDIDVLLCKYNPGRS